MLLEGDRQWLKAHAETLDADNSMSRQLVPRLAEAGVFRLGVPRASGGEGSLHDAIEAIAAVAEQSLTAAFTFWGQRAFIEYLLQSPNADLRERRLPDLLDGRLAGATGLSNAMKFLGGIESLQIRAAAQADAAGWVLDGALPWCTNLRPEGVVVAVAVAREDGGAPMIVALPGDRAGVLRSEDLDLIALRGSNTAALRIDGVSIDPSDVIHQEATRFLPQARPAFLGLQCGMSIGLARAALATARELANRGRNILEAALSEQQDALHRTVDALHAGLADGRFVARPMALFRLRLALADIVQQAVQLELLASGGRAYHRDQPLTFARRWREAAFIPIVTPSVTQLRGEIARVAAQDTVAA